MNKYEYYKADAFTSEILLGNPAAFICTNNDILTDEQMLRIGKEHKGFVSEIVFMRNSEGSANSAFANYLIEQKMWNGNTISIEQGGADRIYNIVKLSVQDGKILFGGKAILKLCGQYFVN
jgi:predicted PhzF superfamily epimerase YddE/YHI9